MNLRGYPLKRVRLGQQAGREGRDATAAPAMHAHRRAQGAQCAPRNSPRRFSARDM